MKTHNKRPMGQVWLKLVKLLCGRRFLNIGNLFLLLLPKNALCIVWLKLVQWLLLHVYKSVIYYTIISPWKRLCPSFESLLPKDALWQVWFKFGLVVQERKTKMWKVYTNDDRQRTSIDQKSSLQPSSGMSLKSNFIFNHLFLFNKFKNRYNVQIVEIH